MSIINIYANAWYDAACKAHKTNSDVWNRVADKLWQRYNMYYMMVYAKS